MQYSEMLSKANELLVEKKYFDVELLCKRVLLQDPINIKALETLARLACACGEYQVALGIFENQLNCSSSSLECLLSIVEAYSKDLQHDKISSLILRIMDLSPSDVEVAKFCLRIAFRTANLDMLPFEDFKSIVDVPSGECNNLFFHAVTVVWGKAYTELFANYVVPTQLGPQNINALNSNSRSLYVIYTTREDAKYIKESACFVELVKNIDIRIYMIDKEFFNEGSKYEVMNLCHVHAIKNAHLHNAHLVFLAPDAIFSAETFSSIYKLSLKGYRAIMTGTMRVAMENFTKILDTIFSSNASIESPIDARLLVKHAINNPHPDTVSCFVDAEKFTSWPSQIFWNVQQQGIVAHNFHLHPIMLYPEEMSPFIGTIDDGCVQMLCKNFDDIYIVQDSDEIVGFDLSKSDTQNVNTGLGFDKRIVAEWMGAYTNEFHRKYINAEISLHSDEIGILWNSIRVKACNLVEDVLMYQPDRVNHIFPEMLTDLDLNYPAPILDSVSFQLTSKCNLRCVYCPQHWSSDRGQDMDEQMAQRIVDFIVDTGVELCTLGFYGETLVLKGWMNYAQQLLDHGVKLHICSSFNMPLSDQECTILSMFSYIQFSIDTSDAGILKEVRPPADLKTMLLNMHKIRAAAIKSGREKPRIQWCCTLVDKVVSQLVDLVCLAISNDIREINLNELGYFDGRELPVGSIFALKGKAFFEAATHVNTARRIAKDNGIVMTVSPTWSQMVEDKTTIEKVRKEFGVEINISKKPIELGKAMQNIQGVGRFYSQKTNSPGPGETRACLLPWSSPYIMPDGSVYSCCVRGQRMGKIDFSTSIRDVMNDAKYHDLRKQLITGCITDETCLNCQLTAIIPVGRLKYKVANLIRSKRETQNARK